MTVLFAVDADDLHVYYCSIEFGCSAAARQSIRLRRPEHLHDVGEVPGLSAQAAGDLVAIGTEAMAGLARGDQENEFGCAGYTPSMKVCSPATLRATMLRHALVWRLPGGAAIRGEGND